MPMRQNMHYPGQYYARIDAENWRCFVVSKLTRDDELRRAVIQLICNFTPRHGRGRAVQDIRFGDYFAGEAAACRY